MIKEVIKFKDLDKKEVVGDFYFHFTMADVIRMEVDFKGGFYEYMNNALKNENRSELYHAIELIVSKSYGQRALDNVGFIKDSAKTEWFMSTDAYSELILALFGDTDRAARFVNGVFPEKMLIQMAKNSGEAPLWEKENRPPTKSEMDGMDREELLRATMLMIENKDDKKAEE